MPHSPNDVRNAVVGFTVLLCKGLLDDDHGDWDLECFDTELYRAGFGDPTILRTTLAVFLNNLLLDDSNSVVNYNDARFRGFQYFRGMIDPAFPLSHVTPPFEPSELEELDWREWEV
ncbi:MAG: hypothetical protein ACK5PB_22590 [Pirellula sp.]|jgi:hypothetical protein